MMAAKATTKCLLVIVEKGGIKASVIVQVNGMQCESLA